MATAVAEVPVSKEEFIANWKMPPINVGQSVVWYAGGQVNSTAPRCGMVIHVSMRSIEVIVQERDRVMRYRDVHNINDPRIRENENISAYGGWDYTESDKKVAALEKRVADLEIALK